MDTHSEYVLEQLCKRNLINQWIKGKYKEKPLIIYGLSGTGKTSLAKFILREFITIEINIGSCRSIKNLPEFLNQSLYKKSITMMFENEKSKALLLDDLKHIQENDKKLFKQILDFSKKKITHPIIYIFNSISHKTVQSIYKHSFPIHIQFSDLQYISLIKKFYSKSDDTINYKELIQKSNYNLNNIQINLDFYQGKTKEIQVFQKKEDEIFTFLKKIYDMKDINDIYRVVINDYMVISLNILENCIHWIFHSGIPYQKIIKLIHNIYLSCCIGDTFNNVLQKTYYWGLIDHITTMSLIIPLRYLTNHNIIMDRMIYNKYLSRSIIYTHSYKILQLHNLDINKLEYLYSLFIHKEYIQFCNLCKYYKIDAKICEKYSKYFMCSISKKDFIKILN